MLYALTLAGFVFLFVTFWHFVFERLMSPADELEPARLRMDLYVVLFAVAVVLFARGRSYFPSNIYSAILLVISVTILIFLVWNFIANKVGSSELASWWREQKEQKDYLKRRESVVLDLWVGIFMAIIFSLYLHEYPSLADPEDASMDFAMTVNQCGEGRNCSFPNKGKNNIPPKIVLLNIDDGTYEKWGRPLLIPRNHLKQLIDSAAIDGARLIVVDIFLSEKTPTDGGLGYSGDKLHSDDQVLRDYLASYDQKNCGDNKCPPIVLIRNSFRHTKSGFFGVDKWPVSRMRPSFLDESIKSSSPTSLIQWASPVFWVSKFDGSLRRWWLWQPVCENDKPKFIPSVELLVASLTSKEDKNYKAVLTQLNEVSSNKIDPSFVEQTSCPPTYEPKSLPESIIIGNLTIEKDELSGGGINQRIMFIMPWEGESSKITRVTAKFDSGDKEILTVLPAYRYLNPDSMSSFNGDIKDSVVIIGYSHFDTADMHKTPLGNMPGMMVIANGIYSLFLNGGQIESPVLTKFILEFVCLLIFAIFINIAVASSPKSDSGWHKYVGYWPAMFVVTGIIGGLFILSSSPILSGFWGWEGGIWIDFSLPLVTIFFHHIVTRFHDLGKEKKEAMARETEVREQATKVEREWQVCQEELRKCKQDTQQLLAKVSRLEKGVK